MYEPKKGTVLCIGKPTYLVTMGGKTFGLDGWWGYIDDENRHWVVPEGFVYDLASIPRWIWWIQWGPWNNGAVIHDFAYVFGYLLLVQNNRLIEKTVSKQEADDLFADVTYSTALQFRQTKDAPLWRIGLMHLAVSLFGRGVWRQPKERWLEYGKPLDKLQVEYQNFLDTTEPVCLSTCNSCQKERLEKVLEK